MPEKNILIADDDQGILDMLKEMIQREGYRVFLTSNGKEAVEAVKINPIDLAILDIKMPVMDGIEALEEIKKIDQGIEVLIMTGYAGLETLTQAISDHGAFDYILNPFKRADILNGIKNALLKQDFASQKKPREKELEERILQLEKEFHERTHQLRESQIKYKDIVENSNDAIVVIQDEKLKFANTKTVELTGYPQEELKDMSFLEMVHPEDRNMVEEIYKSEDFPGIFSFRALRKSGESLFVEINAMRTMYEGRPAIMVNIRDITERKQAEEALRESEERYRLLAENTLDVIWKMDLNLEFTYVNSAILDTLGFTPEEWIGTRLPEHCSPEEIQKIESIIAHELENLEKHTGMIFEANFFNKNGEEIPGEVNGKILFGENGKPIGFQGSSRDITERKAVEEALRKSEAQKKALLDASIDRIRLVDTDMKIIWANKTAARELNVAPEDLVGQFCYEALIGKDTPCHGCPTTKALKTGNIEQAILHHPYSKGIKGETYWDSYAVPIKNESGDILNFIQVSRNITERKRVEETLRESEQQLKGIIASVTDHMSMIDEHHNIVWTNDVAKRLFGPDLIGKKCYAAYHRRDKVCELCVVEKTFADDNIHEHETEVIGADGEKMVFWCTASVAARHGDGRPRLVVENSRDITERKRAEEEIKRRNRELIALNAITTTMMQGGLDLNEVIQRTANCVVEGLGCNSAFIFLLDEEEGVFKGSAISTKAKMLERINAIINFPLVQLKIPARRDFNEAMSNLLDGRPTIKHDFYKLVGPLWSKPVCYAMQGLLDSRTFFSIPLLVRRKTVGGIVASTRDEVSEGNSETMMTFANQAAIAIENARLYEQAQQENAIRKQAEEALKQTNEELLKEHNQRKMLSKRLIDLLEKDRRQIAMELHDHIGQILTSLKMNLEMIHGKLKPGHTELGAQMTAAQEKTIQAIKDVKNISHGLRPAMIDALGVVSSLRELFNEIEQQTDMEIHFFSRGIPKRFEEEKELAIYRIAQDALTNIIRHARAKNVFVNLVKKDEKLSLSVEDDGAGFDYHKAMQASGSKGALGLLIMRERAVQLDGEFTLESQPGKGTHLLMEIPI